MNKRLFFLRQDGWFEAEVAGTLLHATDEKLILWAYAMMDQHGYRNYLITENPRPSLRATQPECPVNENGYKCVAWQTVCTDRSLPGAALQNHSVSDKQIAVSAITASKKGIIR